MNNKLTQDQLAQVVAEVERLSQRREAELNREEVNQILQELSLPPDLLDDALVQVERRQALEVQQKRNRWIGISIAAVLVGIIAIVTLSSQQKQQAYSRISPYQSRITLAQDNGSNLTGIDRQANPKVYYRVTLQDAPIGEKLSLSCDWIDPNGKIAHQNRYETRQIDKSIWPTFCYYQLGSAAAAGNWKVQMSLGNRILSSASFTVK